MNIGLRQPDRVVLCFYTEPDPDRKDRDVSGSFRKMVVRRIARNITPFFIKCPTPAAAA
jgi:hypothetical protein